MKTGKKGRISNQERMAARKKQTEVENINEQDNEPKEMSTPKDDDNELIDADLTPDDKDIDLTMPDSDPIDDDPTLKEAVIDKPYTHQEVTYKGTPPDSTPEPEIATPVIDFTQPQPGIEDPMSDGTGSGGPFKPEEPPKAEPRGSTRNPAFDDLSSKQQTMSAKHLADTCIAVYELINQKGAEFCQLPEDKLLKKSMKNKFDMDVLYIELPIPGTRKITVKQWLDEKNQTIGNVCIVTQEFKDEVRPLLIEIFKEQGWGMTPTQRLILAVSMDAGIKALTLLQLRSEMNGVLDLLYTEYKKARQTQAAAQATPPPPTLTTEVKKEDIEVVETEEVVFQKKEIREPA